MSSTCQLTQASRFLLIMPRHLALFAQKCASRKAAKKRRVEIGGEKISRAAQSLESDGKTADANHLRTGGRKPHPRLLL